MEENPYKSPPPDDSTELARLADERKRDDNPGFLGYDNAGCAFVAFIGAAFCILMGVMTLVYSAVHTGP